MGGEVALARRLERIGKSMARDGLERVARAGPVVAVIDDQGRAALRARRRGETSGTMARDAGRGLGLDLARAARTGHPASRRFELASVGVDLADRQRVEEFVGDDQQRAARRAGSKDRRARPRPAPAPPGRRAGPGWSRPDGRRAPARRPHRPQRVGGQRAAARAELDIMRAAPAAPRAATDRRARLPTSSPNIWLISGAVTKSPAAPKRIAGRVIMRVRLGHIVGDGDRALGGDAAPQPLLKWRPAHPAPAVTRPSRFFAVSTR